MAVKHLSFEQGILKIHEAGRIGAADAQHFEQLVYEHANANRTPIVVLIDAREVDIITPEANQGFIRAASIANVKLYVVATDGLVITQAANILALRNPRKNTIIFESWEDAVDYAYEQAEFPAYS